jgi:hypothetical protein
MRKLCLSMLDSLEFRRPLPALARWHEFVFLRTHTNVACLGCCRATCLRHSWVSCGHPPCARSTSAGILRSQSCRTLRSVRWWLVVCSVVVWGPHLYSCMHFSALVCVRASFPVLSRSFIHPFVHRCVQPSAEHMQRSTYLPEGCYWCGNTKETRHGHANR